MFFNNNKNWEAIIDFAANEGIEWKFIPPRAPHFGGLWEAGVRSVKLQLKRVVAEASFTYENFSTILIQIEAILNSRPLHPMSSDPQDLNPIIPGHFLIGRPITSLPDQPLQHIPEGRLAMHQRLQKLIQTFWDRWRRDYISELQVCSKWKVKSPCIQKNDMIVIKEDHIHPCNWKLGRVLEVHNGSDGLPRVDNTVPKWTDKKTYHQSVPSTYSKQSILWTLKCL